MPSASNIIGTVLTMDTQSFALGAQEARRLIRDLTKEFDASDAGMGRWQKSIQGVGKRMEFLEAKMKVEEALIKNYQNEINKLSQDYTKNESRIRSLEEGIRNARVEINKYAKQLEDCQEQLDKMWIAAEEANTPLYKLNRIIEEQEKELADLILRYKNLKLSSGDNIDELQQLEFRISSLNDELRENRSILAQIDGSADALTRIQDSMPKGFTVLRGFVSNLASNAVYDAIHRIGDAMREIVETSIEWESAFTGVRRTVEGTESDFINLESALRGMSTTVATPLAGIAEIATLAGQMGIPIEQISEFTRVMIMLGDTTNITAEEAGDSLARLSNLLNLSIDDFERMGSTIVDLGNKFPTTESEIAAMASRLGGTANMLHITADEVLGIANAISAVGLEAEMGGNAVSKTLREMQLAVENGTDKLAVFASTAGMTIDEFSALFSGDATEALRVFINGLGDVDRNDMSVTQILKSLNITELRQVDTLSRLATNTDTLNDSLEAAKDAWRENTALSTEANKRYQTIESRLQMMKNAWSNVAIELSQRFNPALRSAIDFTTSLARTITGQKGASEQLDVAITNLRSATEQYRDAQDDAKESTDALTRAMVQLRKEQQRQSMISLVEGYSNSLEELNNLQMSVTKTSYDVRTALDSLTKNSKYVREGQEYGIDLSNLSTEDVLDLYDRIDEFRRRAEPTIDTIFGKLRTGQETWYKRLVDVLEGAGSEIENYKTALSRFDVESERIWQNQEVAFSAYADLFDSGDISYTDLVGRVKDDNLIQAFHNIEIGWVRGKEMAQEYLKTISDEDSLRSYLATLNEQQESLELTSDGYWGIEASIAAVRARAEELGIQLEDLDETTNEIISGQIGDFAKSADSIWNDMVEKRRRQDRVASVLGIPIDDGEIMSLLQGTLNEFIAYQSEAETKALEAQENGFANLVEYYDAEYKLTEEYIEKIGAAYRDLASRNVDSDPIEYNWWDRFLGRDTITDRQKEITDGLEAMMNDIQSIFDSIGQSIFDMVDDTIQNQIDVITNEIELLDDKLEEQKDKIDETSTINENNLRKRLQEGAIDEEEYYRLSAQNKYDAEAQKQKAEKDTQDERKKLLKEQDSLERKQFESNKANQIAQIIIDTASAIVKSSTSLPWPWNLVPMSAMAGIGAAQLAVASSQTYTPALATGGIVSAPTTALIGEAGKEAVLPLEQNTDWMDELAYRIGSIITSDRIRTAIDRTMNEDGRTVDRTSNMQFTQIINSPKALSRKEIYRDTRRLVRMVDRRIS